MIEDTPGASRPTPSLGACGVNRISTSPLIGKWRTSGPAKSLLLGRDYKQSAYRPLTVGSSITVPSSSSFTRTPIRAESVPQPNGAHPEVRRDPNASDP